MTRNLRLGLCALLSLLLVPIACGGGKGPKPIDIDYGQELGMQEVHEVPAGTDDGEREVPGDQLNVHHRFDIIFLHDTSSPIVVKSTETLTIRAKVIDYAQNVPASGVLVHYEILQVANLDGSNADTFDGSFEIEDIPADADGIAANTFRSGMACDLKYTIEASLPDEDALPKTLEILVPCASCGCANVSLTYEGALPETALKDMDIYILPTDYTCAVLYPDRAVPDAVLQDRSIPDLYGSTQFDCLPADTTYTLYALGHRQGSPCVVSYGCTEGAYLKADECSDRAIKMYLATMNPAGIYDCIDHFDFTNLVKQCAGGDTTILSCVSNFTDLGQSVCCVLSEMIKFFNTPGLTIVETIVDVAKQLIGSIIVDTVANLFKDAVANIITQYLLNNSPDFIKDFFTIGGDMMGTITNLEMMSELKLAKLSNEFTMQGDQFWHGLALYWKFGCDPSAPDYDTCGRIPLDLQSLNDPLFPKDLLGGKFTANLYDFDKLHINQHAIKLNYGKLVLYVLNQVIIKALTGGKADSLIEVAYLWIDCANISQGILGQIYGWFGGTQADLENVCKTTIDFLFGFLNQFIGALSLDTELSISGEARLVDTPDANQWCDLKVDAITKGVNLGYIQGNSSQASVTGDFECVRK